MPIDRNQITLGLTGSFGSGCSTLASALEDEQFKRVSLSSGIRAELRLNTSVSSSKTKRRQQLQDFGNDNRLEHGAHYWAEEALKKADELEEKTRIVFDGIRNVAEIEYLRKEFPNFYLITVWSPRDIRWERVKDIEYDGNYTQFLEDDRRDSDEEIEYGQQVQICVDKADIVLRNEQLHSSPPAAKRYLSNKVAEYLKLITKSEVRPPTSNEVAMSIAHTTSLRSLCLKRTVGAAITSHQGILVSVGFNENPASMKPCIYEYTYCFKDLKLRDHILAMIKKSPKCPGCDKHLEGAEHLRENTKCGSCGYNLSRAYSPDRGMGRCTAVHAEMAAILNAAGTDLGDKILYTTTFPCSQCARQIAYVGIKKVVYIEPYPDTDSESFLTDSCHIVIEMFEGVKARAYGRIFGNVRELNEKRYTLP